MNLGTSKKKKSLLVRCFADTLQYTEGCQKYWSQVDNEIKNELYRSFFTIGRTKYRLNAGDATTFKYLVLKTA